MVTRIILIPAEVRVYSGMDRLYAERRGYWCIGMTLGPHICRCYATCRATRTFQLLMMAEYYVRRKATTGLLVDIVVAILPKIYQ